MSNNAAACLPPNGGSRDAGCRESQIIITSDLSDANEAVNLHFMKSIGGGEAHSRQWPQRNLPEKFFSKPNSSANTSVAHSRDGSADSSGRFTISPPAAYGATTGTSGPSALAASIQHSRTQSSPATLSAQMSLPPSGAATHFGANGRPPIPGSQGGCGRQQPKHRSMDNTLDVDSSPLPHGWEKKFTENGQPFYINSVDKTTTWEDPRKSLSASNLTHNVISSSSGGTTGASSQLGPLPPGWEEAFAPTGERYFINHNEKTTSWYDPRLPEEVQKPYIVQRLMSQQQGGRPSACALGPNAAPFRYGHHHQQASRGQLPPSANRAMAAGAASFSPMIQELNQERLRIYERNMELRDQGLLDRLSPVHPLSPGRNVGGDAFLGMGVGNQYAAQMSTGVHYPQTTSDIHIRQESSDSGLGMPVGYPHTPENYLGNSDIDLSFSGINLVDSTMQMDVDPTNIPATLDGIGIAPNELDQYLNH